MSADPRLARARPSSAAAPSSQPSQPPRVPSRPTASTTPDARNTSNGQTSQVNGAEQEDPFKLRFCTVCASNNNRSMEGHLRLAGAKYPVISFGTGSLVRLPGPSANQPNVYEFNSTSYDAMHQQLQEKDSNLYRSNGILTILERNRGIKQGPERWQNWNVGEPRMTQTKDMGFEGSQGGVADIVVTCEERCWDAVVEDLLNRGAPLNRPVHIINMDIKDSHEEGLVGGKAIVDLADSLNRAAVEERMIHGEEGWAQGNGPGRAGFDERVSDILADWQERWEQFPALWTVAWF